MDLIRLKDFLDKQLDIYYHSGFIDSDPISLPHKFSKLQDIEIIAFWIAMLAWGRRETIIKKGKELLNIMDNAPYDFVINHTEKDLKRISTFKHRTFQPEDSLYFLHFLKQHYSINDSLESAFSPKNATSVKDRLTYFHEYFFDSEYAPQRTQKHIATPAKGSACKRLNMFLRWMVRNDDKHVDFGLWKSITPGELMIPLDVHVGRVARKYGLLERKASDWKSVEELTENLQQFDKNDPVKYDYALFSLGVNS